MMLDLDQAKSGWRPPIKQTVASQGTGIDELIATIDGHIAYLESSGELTGRRKARTRNELLALIEERISRHVLKQISASGRLDAMVDALEKRLEDPYAIVAKLVTEFLR